MSTWKGLRDGRESGTVEKEIRSEQSSLTDDTLFDFAARAHEKDDGLNKFKDLYAYLFRRLNQKMKLAAAGTGSGFEVFRRIVREEDPATESTE